MQVVECDNIQDFCALAKLIYRDDANYIPTDDTAHIATIIKNNSRAKMLLVPNKARLMMIPVDNKCLLGYFEAIEDHSVVQELFSVVRSYCAQLNLQQIIGPINCDTWHRYRFSVGPQNKPFLLEPYNPCYYTHLWENAGFTIISEYYSRHIKDFRPMIKQLKSAYQEVVQSGFRLRCFNKKNFQRDIKIIYDISCATFVENFMYSQISFDDFLQLYLPEKPLICERLIIFVENKDGLPVGFFLAIPDLFNAVKAYKTGVTPFKQIQFAWHKAFNNIINCKTIAIIPEYRRLGLASAMQYKVYVEGLKLGYRSANLCLIHEDNVSDRINLQQGNIIRRYRLYGLPL